MPECLTTSRAANQTLNRRECPKAIHSFCTHKIPYSAILLILSKKIALFQQIRLARRHARERLRRAGGGYCTLVAVHAAVMPHLQEKRAIAEMIASFHASAATDAEMLIDNILVIRIFHVRALECANRALLIFRGGSHTVRLCGFGLKEAEA